MHLTSSSFLQTGPYPVRELPESALLLGLFSHCGRVWRPARKERGPTSWFGNCQATELVNKKMKIVFPLLQTRRKGGDLGHLCCGLALCILEVDAQAHG